MKKLVSLLAIALVSSLFAAGCGKFKNCDEATSKGIDVCKDDSQFEGLQCKWDVPTGKEEREGKCVIWTPGDAAKAACGAVVANKEACEKADSTEAGTKCSWNDKADPKCHAVRAPAEKKKDK